MCAERVAIFKAVSDGVKDFSKIAIVSKSDSEKFKDIASNYTFPCGLCLQVMSEFMLDADVILQGTEGGIKTFKVKDLLPYSFTVES